MKEIRDIISSYDDWSANGKRCALATVVHVDGSSYRRPGARMLVNEDGLITGAISGGCLEGDALRKALLAMNQGTNKLVTYDTTDEDAAFGVQLGCNGIVHILFEPIINNVNPVTLLREVVENNRAAVLVTMYSLKGINQPGTVHLSSSNNAEISEGLLQSPDSETIRLSIEETLHSGTSQHLENVLPGVNAFIEYIAAPVSLVIAGAGNDVLPLVDLAATVGWNITVVDGRPTHATHSRFPRVQQVLVSKATDVPDELFNPNTFVLLMTHNYNYDLEILKRLMQVDVRYIGVLGPKSKLERMLGDLAAAGIDVFDQTMDRVYGPLGLDLGAETAAEIAVSIVAEIMSVVHGTSGASLKLKATPIHQRKAIERYA